MKSRLKLIPYTEYPRSRSNFLFIIPREPFERTTWKYFQRFTVVIRAIKRLKFDKSIGERKQWKAAALIYVSVGQFFSNFRRTRGKPPCCYNKSDYLSFLSLSLLSPHRSLPFPFSSSSFFLSLSFFSPPSPPRLITEGRAIF